jgi:Prolipoprotein diacylglyceryl transferase
MAGEMFLLGLALFYSLLLAWAFKVLPLEKWQILASVPDRKMGDETWAGRNFTFYGFFTACAYAMATAITFILLSSVGVPIKAIIMVSVFMAVLCVPASRWVAAMVEKKSHTSTVAGAAFVGMIVAPWAICLANMVPGSMMDFHIDVMSCLAAFSIAYSLGEGTGRLACISFGCCYGRPVTDCHPVVRSLFSRFNFVFEGKTKKIAYASGLDGEPVIPVQAITSVLYISSALLGVYLFVKGKPTWAFLVTTSVTQLWRVASEFLRADYRGSGRFSAYQWMSVISVVYAVFIGLIFVGHSSEDAVDVMGGLLSLWDPGVLIFLQSIWLILFLTTGKSMVTGSVISFHVIKDRV